MRDPAAVAKAFEQFALECHDSSPVYERLSLELTHDEELLALAGQAAGRKQPIPNLLFAAVRFLLFRGDGKPDFSELQSLANFRQFCLTHSTEIQTILTTRRVQTNEVGRCSYLFPAFVFAASALKERPLALIEIGTSAGLLLNWDRYAYRYGDGELLGPPNSPLKLACAIRGPVSPTLPQTMPAVSSKVGIDLHVIDVRDENDSRWLRALVWPEHVDRDRMLAAAIELQREYPVRLLQGDGLLLIKQALADIHLNGVPCVFHTAVLNQFSREQRTRLEEALSDYGETSDLVWISAELGNQPTTAQVEITIWLNGTRQHRVLAYAHPHGRWLEWIQ
jgi:hypothetical protein